MGDFWTGVVTALACTGGCWLGLKFRGYVFERYKWHKTHKSRKASQKSRLRMYEAGDRKPASILLAQEYAAELAQKKQERPRLIKATGLFSDEAAQALLR